MQTPWNGIQRGKIKRGIGSRLFVYGVTIPVLLYFIVFSYYPFFMNIIYSFCKYDYISLPKFIGLDNYMRFFHDGEMGRIFLNTAVITIFSLPGIVIISLLIAVALFNLTWGKAGIRSAIFATFLTSNVVAAIVFKQLFGEESGFINNFIESLGMSKIPWFSQPRIALLTIIIVTVWNSVGYYMVILLAGISGIDRQLYEAATIDGAGILKKFFYITIPQLKATLIFVILMSTLGCLRTYSIVVVLTNGGPYSSTRTVLMEMFDQGIAAGNVGYASCIAVVMSVIMMIISVAQLKVSKYDAD